MTSYINTTSFADAQTGTKVVFLNKKHTGMLSCDILKIKILHWKPYLQPFSVRCVLPHLRNPERKVWLHNTQRMAVVVCTCDKMACCKCNKKGSCKSCFCVKQGNFCVNCAPGRCGSCANRQSLQTAPAGPPPVPVPPFQTSHPLSQALSQNVLPSPPRDHTADGPVYFPPCVQSPDRMNDHPLDSHVAPPLLPDFVPSSDPMFAWDSIDCLTFYDKTISCYNEIAHWKRNLFKIPLGKSGKAFVSEQARLFQAYADSTTLESVALFAAMIMPPLLLQRPPGNLKTKALAAHLERRLLLWHAGDLDSLMLEGRLAQSRLQNNSSRADTSSGLAQRFTNLMLVGNVKAALGLLENSVGGGTLSLHSSVNGRPVKDILLDKHPPAQPCSPSTVTSIQNPPEYHPILFDALTPQLIRSSSLKTSGSSGPSGLDGSDWRRMCTSFHRSSNDLCNALSSFGKRLCVSFVDPSGLYPFLASRLIAIDKHPGVRPIGVGEVVRRIIGKAVLRVISYDVLEACGLSQLCAGQPCGCETAVHAVRNLFETSECFLLVDATNAFNSLNRRAALHNISNLCPALSTMLINCYRVDVPLFMDGDTIFSAEGTTQGDPLAMIMYAIGILPLIHYLNSRSVSQVWYADDAAAVGDLTNVRVWWDEILSRGPSFGYFPNPSKSWLVVKPELVSTAKSIFADVNINITSEGRCYLGSPIGSSQFVSTSIQSKISEWVSQLELLTTVATTQPHPAFAALIHGFTNKWSYYFRSTPGIDAFIGPLEECLRNKLLPTLTGQSSISDSMRSLLSLPPRLGGMGIVNLHHEASAQYSSSLFINSPLFSSIIRNTPVSIMDLLEEVSQRKNKVKADRLAAIRLLVSELSNTTI